MELRPYQVAQVQSIADAYVINGLNRVLFKSPTGCHAKGQGIQLWSGDIKAVEDIQVGDSLRGPDGTPRLVTALARGEDEMVWIIPTKGTPWKVNIDHVLTLQRTNISRRLPGRRANRDGELVDVTVRDWMAWSRTQKHIHKLLRRPAEWAYQPVEIDPYVLGLLLGDGTLSGDTLGFSNIDAEPLEAMHAYAAANGLEMVQLQEPREATHRLRSLTPWERSPLTGALRRMGLFPIAGSNRFVPRHFKLNSRGVRLELLAGLIDSDGASSDGGFDYSSTSKTLAADVTFIARSLGLAAYETERETKSQNGTACTSWRVFISGDCSIVPCRVQRKRARPRSQAKDVLRTGFTLEYAGRDDYFGFSLTGDGRYLLDDFTVTHNTGKTQVFGSLPGRPELAAFWDQFPKKTRRMLVIAHRKELIDQAWTRIRQLNPGIVVDIEQGDQRASSYADVIVASIQTLAAEDYRRLRRFLRHGWIPQVVVIDEAHHAAATTYRAVLAILGFLPAAITQPGEAANYEAATFDDVEVMETALKEWDAKAPKDRLLVGVTATPNRSDAIGLGCVFQTLTYNYALRDAINDGWLVPIEPRIIDTSASLDAVRTSRGDFNQKDLAEAVNTPERNRLAVEAVEKYARDVSTIAFAVDVQHAHDLCAMFIECGVSAAVISGETDKDVRRHILTRYQEGQITVLCNCMVLTEGTDLPIAGCILHCKPTKSATLYEQMTGRGLRLYPGKTKCVVIDMVDLTTRHSLQTVPMLYGLPPGLKAVKMLEEELKDLEDFKAEYPNVNLDEVLGKDRLTIDQLRVKMRTFDIWAVPSMGTYGKGLHLNWIRTGEESFRLSFPWENGLEIVTVEPNLLGKFDVVVTNRARDNFGTARQRTLVKDVDGANPALTIAEAYVNNDRAGASKLVSRGERWRKDPISDGQVKMLRRLRIPFTNKMTKGEASDRIEMANARRAR